ncbi:MAG: 3'-5' exonuclease, partial [Pseudomonadota bacterium]
MIRTPIVTFDIETIPDADALRAAGLADPELDDTAAVRQAQAQRLEKTGSDFLPIHCQRVLVISCTFRNHEGLKIHSFVDQGGQEGQVVQQFFRVIEKH